MSYKNEQKYRERERERERERVLTVLCEKNINWIVEMISNLYKIK